MSIILFNPTSEDLERDYAGSRTVIPAFGKPGHKVKVEDAKGKHLLNALGPRGLTSLEYGDEADSGVIEAQKAEDGRQRNLDFKRKQVARYNQDNEARKAQQMAYMDPPKQIKEYAKEIGVGLIEPYQVADIKNEEIAELKKGKAEAEKALIDMSKKFEAMFNILQAKGLMMTPEEELEQKIAVITQEYKMLRPDPFRKWVKDLGFDKYSEYPLEVQQDMINKWVRFFEDEKKDPFPY